MTEPMRVLVLQGGPDREAVVSRKSAGCVAAALRQAGHTVSLHEIGPDDLTALEAEVDVIFPVLHGPWGEGGTLQQILEERGTPFVGSPSRAARIAMDKSATKRLVQKLGLYTPMWQILHKADELTMAVPLVLKPIDDGSSFGVRIVHEADQVESARAALQSEFKRIFAERFIAGRELTVGIVGDQALPPLEIRPNAAFYDYSAKYDADDTGYSFDLGIHEQVVKLIQDAALAVHQAVGARHLSRVDFILDEVNRPWVLEINTLPGFTDHSLLPKAAAHTGLDMPRLCDRLIQLARSSQP